ncbi:MAG: Wzz/FepE/Etk N-terminal domain-containing protein [Bacteroidia bacterium]
MLSETEQKQESIQVIKFIQQHKKQLILYPTIAIVLSIIITFFIPKQYASSGIVFPPDHPSLDNNISNPNFGYDIEADRLLQILQSNTIMDSVSRKFNLFDYYELDKKNLDWRDRLTKEYKGDVQFERTAYMSIIISAQTKNPEMSASIVNYIIDITNKVREKLYKQNVEMAYNKASSDFLFQKHIADSMLFSLKKDIERLHISGLVLLAPSAHLNFDYVSKANSDQPENISLGENILKYRHQLDRQNDFEGKYIRVKKMMEDPVPSIYVLDHAIVSYKKVLPSFTINAFISGFIALLLTILLAVLKTNK